MAINSLPIKFEEDGRHFDAICTIIEFPDQL